MKNQLLKNKIITGLVLFPLFFLFYFGCAELLDDDIKGHANTACKMITEGRLFDGTFILYLLTAILSFFSTNVYYLRLAICFLLAFASLLRFFLVQERFYHLDLYTADLNKNYRLSLMLGLSLIFVFALSVPGFFKHGYMYLGTFTPNVWHNSTTIFLMPFAFLLYTESSKQLTDYSFKHNYLLIALIFLNIFIKPSFFLVFVCVYPLMMLYRYRFAKTFWTSLIPLIFGLIFLLWQYLNIYNKGVQISAEDKSSVGICFMCVFKMRSAYLDLPVSIFFSLLFPIVYTIWNKKTWKKNITQWYIIWMMAFAVIIYLFIVELGPRLIHGNFFWQIVPCAWIYFYITLNNLIKDIKSEGFTHKNKTLLFLYFIHVIVGVLYLARIFIARKYY